MTSESTLAIEASGLVKTFGETHAVDGLDLRVPAGGVYGVLGPNGAGKTTAIRMLATLLPPDAGTAHGPRTRHRPRGRRRAVKGEPDRAVRVGRRRPDRHREPRAPRAAARFHDRKAARNRADELLDAFGLTDAAKRQVKTYSGGMRRRLDIAASIVVTPDLIFLDEPTTGLDPRSRNQVWDIVRALVGRRHHGAADDAVSRRSRPARRPHRHHRSRQGHRRRDERRAQGLGGVGRAARASQRRRAAAGRGARAVAHAWCRGAARVRPSSAIRACRRRRTRGAGARRAVAFGRGRRRTSRSGSRASTKSSSR